jgi:hypothetical protein
MGDGEGSTGGGGGGGDPQRLKRIGAAAYDYENDSRWAGYWSNVLVPPHLASRPDVVDHFKRKFYQRYIDPDLIVEPMSSTSSSQSTKPAARSSATPSNENVRARDSGTVNCLFWYCCFRFLCLHFYFSMPFNVCLLHSKMVFNTILPLV